MPETQPHSHYSTETLAVFPPYAESLLLAIARAARKYTHAPGPEVSAIDPDTQTALKDIRERLGSAYPDLLPSQDVVVATEFARLAPTLDTVPDRYKYGPQEDHSQHEHSHACSNRAHGPIRQRLHQLERRALQGIRNQRLRLVAATALRGGSLLFCPGDDVAAIGLQMYGAFAGHTSHAHGHVHQEIKAVLPRRPGIDFATGTAIISLPLDTYFPPDGLPITPQGDMIRDHIV